MHDFFNKYYQFLSEQFSNSISEKIINGFKKDRYTTFRVNTLKIDIDKALDLLKKEDVQYSKYNLLNNAFYFNKMGETKALKLKTLNDGLIYLQSFSSMIPAFLMEPKENEYILDITAAPGSKTTLMAALSNNKAKIYANEKDKIRFERLRHNVELLNANVNLINDKAENLNKDFNQFFDKILVDAPCSGEGLFEYKNPSTYRNWSVENVTKFSRLQQKILDSGLITLKDGGLCVYSTCTLNKYENENVLVEINKKYEIKNVDEINLFERLPNVLVDFVKLDNMGAKAQEQLKIYRLLPSEFFEGFTITVFRKIKRR